MPLITLQPRSIETPHEGFKEITLPTPLMGGKCWVLAEKGRFQLERGPGMLVTANCAHAGSGTLEIFDGVWGEDGRFPAREIAIREFGADPILAPGGDADEADPFFHARNGRSLKRDNPVVMGAWMSNAGFFHGLAVRHMGGQVGVPAVVSIVWMPYRQAPPSAAKPPAPGGKK